MFKLLTTFRAVYETRNFSRAAEVLFYLNQQSRIKSNSWSGIEYRSFQRNGRKRCFQLSKPTYYMNGHWFC